MKQKKLWITYAWMDNYDKDVDFIIQELSKREDELEVHFDRKQLIPAQRHWPEIDKEITNPDKCDAWAMVVTNNSLKREACREELYYALDRALNSRGKGFPMIGLLHNVEIKELPAALRIRLCISLENPNWVDEVFCAVNKIPIGFQPEDIEDFYFKFHDKLPKPFKDIPYCLEVHPRLQRISPFLIAVDSNEADKIKKRHYGPSGIIPISSNFSNSQTRERTKLSDGTEIIYWQADNEVSSTQSYYILMYDLPKRILLGHPNNLKWYSLKQ